MRPSDMHSRTRWINRLARNNIILIACLWTLLITLFLQWNLYGSERQSDRQRLSELSEKLLAAETLRDWIDTHGDSLAPSAGPETAAPPAANGIKEKPRVLSTSARIHLGSLAPLGKADVPTEWEVAVFARLGASRLSYYSETILHEGRETWRMLYPIRLRKSCAGCHPVGPQQVGDTIAGISLEHDLGAPSHNVLPQGDAFGLYLSYGASWLAGMLVIGFIGSQMKNNYAEIEHYQQELEHLATHDALTDFFNRNQMNALLEIEIERAKRYKHNLGLLLLDVDHFKRINDEYGHQAGDLVLITLAETLKKSVRTIDHVARYGGEEFLIIMPETNVEMALVSAERIRAKIEDSSVPLADGREINLTCSIGVSAYPTSGENLDRLLSAADKALYSAKNLGRNRVIYCR